MRGKPKKGYTVAALQFAALCRKLCRFLETASLFLPLAALRLFPCAIQIYSFQNFCKVLKTGSAGRKDFFDTLKNQNHPFYGWF